MRMRDLVKLKKNRSNSEVLDGSDLPNEPKEQEFFVQPDLKSLENISLPKEGELDAILSPEELEGQKLIEEMYTSAYNFMEGVLDNLKRKQRFTIEKGLEIVSNIVDTENAARSLSAKAVLGRGIPDNLAAHSVNVCLYALVLGSGVDYSREQMIDLGITALLHDVGMVFLPIEIVEKNGKLKASELEKIKKHPYYTYKILQSLGEKYSQIAEIAYQEQERDGGQGYPKGLKGEEIHDYAKIIGIVDVYEALTHNRPQRKGFIPHEAVKLILDTQKDFFSNEVKKLLLMKLSCFPLGSFVELNSKAICRVITIDDDSPLRPTVEILFDSGGRKLINKKIVRLADTPLLYIVGTVNDSELPR